MDVAVLLDKMCKHWRATFVARYRIVIETGTQALLHRCALKLDEIALEDRCISRR